ncbi:MAG: RES family NAD+ phosphorylase [Syntrophotaleaceae bacterium]
MKAFRVVPSPRAKDLSGEGARLFGGRWNSKGVPMIYTAAAASLAVLETLVHMSMDVFPENLVMVTMEIPDEFIETLDPRQLPKNWATYPASAEVNEIGDAWAKNETSLGLLVPSAILPQENNLIINPRHPQAGTIKIVAIDPYQVDRRLLKKQ